MSSGGRPCRSILIVQCSHVGHCAIIKQMKDLIRDFPARLLTQNERALVAEWIAGAGDIAEPYVSDRLVDDPTLYHRIVIARDLKMGRFTFSTHQLVAASGWSFHWAIGQGSAVPTFGPH